MLRGTHAAHASLPEAPPRIFCIQTRAEGARRVPCGIDGLHNGDERKRKRPSEGQGRELAKRPERVDREANAVISGEEREASESSQDMKDGLCRTGIIPPPTSGESL